MATPPVPQPQAFSSPAPLASASPRQGVSWKWKLALIAGAVVMCYGLWTIGSGLYQGARLSAASVAHFHEQLNANEYQAIFDEADEGFQQAGTRDESIKFLQAVHTKLGDAGAVHLTNTNVQANTNGSFVVTTYSTTFAHATAVETFTWVKKGGALKLRGYNINSKALVLQ
jgi:hypothetical protein